MMETTSQQLHKFGNNALATSQSIKRISKIIQQYSQSNDLIVVSAMGRMTDQLMNWVKLSTQNALEANQALQTIRHQYLMCASQLLHKPEPVTQPFLNEIVYLSSLLDKPMNEAIFAEVIGHGEIWSGRLLTAYLSQLNMAVEFVDARDFLVAEGAVLPEIKEDISRQQLQPILQKHQNKRLVITGFISQNLNHETVLLGRHGSDYSATQIAALANINKVTIWSDVAGVYSADPNLVKNASLLPFLRVDEAMELARLSTPILHPRSLQPVFNNKLSLYLRSSLEPANTFTRVEHLLASSDQGKIVTHHNNIGLIELVIPADQIFSQWQAQLHNWLLNEQLQPLATSFSETDRTFKLIYPNDVIDNIFVRFRHLPVSLESSSIRYDLALIGIIGSGICQNSLQMMRFFQQLKNQPIEFIWQSPQKISVVAVLKQPVSRELLKNVHDDLFKAHKSIGVVVLGKGEVAKTWLQLYQKEQEKIAARTHFDLTLIGLVSSQKAWLNYQGIDLRPAHIDEDFSKNAKQLEPNQLLAWMSLHPFDELVILDITASDLIAEHYIHYAERGFHVISANKRAGAFPLGEFHKIQNAFLLSGSFWLYNSTVGGGLPINTIVHDLVESGDCILSIEGTFSNSLAWLFYLYDGSVPFSELLEQAWLQGLTERDPREDLLGLDAMRKLLITARSAGYALDHNQIKIQSLIPEKMKQGSVTDFLEQLSDVDAEIERYYQDAQEEGLALRYVARFNAQGQSTIGLEKLALDDPIAHTLPGENLFMVRSHWYRDNPLTIHGPSSGKAMTAGAILSDLNRLTRLL